ncbi:GNAT family N-acetyltransferase [Streptomyces marincola]|uniref:GNAT family N-acetyltransferase n=1 Tax=Streptomyces marincola TaxID=2878388 RepID=UPI0021000866|nr:GNAT family N-acetyltransferase [Streptomyces marincola]
MELEFADIAPGDARLERDVAPLIRTLRPALGAAGFTAFASEAHGQGLVFTAAYDAAGHCPGVVTHRVLATSRGRVLCVDDLVTAPDRRSGGVGRRLMDEMTDRARQAGCVRIELDSGTGNHRAHRFYHLWRMSISALHFTRDIV